MHQQWMILMILQQLSKQHAAGGFPARGRTRLCKQQPQRAPTIIHPKGGAATA
jgi:hypothetical protein